VSSESEPDAFSNKAGPSTRPTDGQAIVDEGHEADDETNMQGERQKRQRVVDTRDDHIKPTGKELKRKGDASGKVDTAYLFFCAGFQFSSQGDDGRIIS
jgi:hypothetical protein